jgi:hypothetical protein
MLPPSLGRYAYRNATSLLPYSCPVEERVNSFKLVTREDPASTTPVNLAAIFHSFPINGASLSAFGLIVNPRWLEHLRERDSGFT